MSQIRFFKAILLFVSLIFLCSAAGCPNPLFLEYIEASKPILSTMDVKQVVQNSLPKEKLNDYSDANKHNYSISSTVFKYDGTKRSVNDQISKVSVIGDNFEVLINFSVKVKTTFGSKTYNGTVKIDYVTVDFTKEISQETKNIVLSKIQTTLSASTFKIDVSGNPNKTQLANIAKGITDNDGKSMLSQLNAIFTRMATTMQENVKTQTLGKAYPTGKYNYIFQNADNSITYDMTTQYLGFGSDKTILINGLKGQIPNQQTVECPVLLREPQGSNHTFITKQFIKNLENHAKNNFRQLKDQRINSTWVKNVAFQFKLVDLEYIVPQALKKYSQYFLNEVNFVCNVVSFDDIKLSSDSKTPNTQLFVWKCSGLLDAGKPDPILILSFTINVQYTLKIVLHGNSFGVLIETMNIQGMEFDIIDGMLVESPEDVKNYINEMSRYFCTWVLGTHFTVKEGSNELTITESGIWVAQTSKQTEYKNLISME